jgi:hypothetical protein
MTALVRERKPGGGWLYAQPVQVRLWLEAAGREGIHTHDMRAAFIANPSERARKLAETIELSTESEPRNGANGSRFWLTEHAPPTAHPVTPANLSSPSPLRSGQPQATNGAGVMGAPAPVKHAHAGFDFEADGLGPETPACGPAWADSRNPMRDVPLGAGRYSVYADPDDDGDESWITQEAA